jgi:hypothetical protein
MPNIGQFVLHSKANPPLKAGDYVLQGRQDIAGGPTEPYDGHLRVTAPRYALPADQLLSTFPPANSEGAYENRLPQVVLKRRTLPWERAPKLGQDDTPWLALVVIAEGEGTLSGDTPIAQCVTPGVTLAGPNDVATGTYLSVSETVVNKVFPTEDDLPLLCHVREVDIRDTELANGDDDGFLAVVMANRLPQYDRTADKPVRYLACLINLEGQLDVLPKPTVDVVGQFLATELVYDVRVDAAAGAAVDTDRFVMGGVAGAAQVDVLNAARRAAGAPRALPAADRDARRVAAEPSTPAAGKTTTSQWSTTQARVEQAALSADQEEASRVVRDVMLEGFRDHVEHYVKLEPVYRFPVLTHWSFTVSGTGGFQPLMLGLDVGLLGTAPAAPDVPAGAPPPPPPPRPPAELAETGHVGLPHLTRRGEQVRAWFRGPLAAHPTTRDAPGADGRLPFAHDSDQLRRVVPDGREDLSLAAAFEIGRLLALSQPALVRALMAWRAEQFGAERARQLVDALAQAATTVQPALDGTAAHDLGALIGRSIVLAAAEDPAKALAPSRPLVDPGRPLPFKHDGGIEQLLGEGFGFSAAAVIKNADRLGPAAALRGVDVTVTGTDEREPLLDGPGVERLRGRLTEAVDRLTADALKARADRPDAARSTRRRKADALDELIARATPEEDA